jgi:hypothetical protein
VGAGRHGARIQSQSIDGATHDDGRGSRRGPSEVAWQLSHVLCAAARRGSDSAKKNGRAARARREVRRTPVRPGSIGATPQFAAPRDGQMR